VNDNGHVGRPCEVSLAPPYPELFASYGASAVTRTSGRGHVAEARTNVIEVSGLSIRVSKETRLVEVSFSVSMSPRSAVVVVSAALCTHDPLLLLLWFSLIPFFFYGSSGSRVPLVAWK
jgi:hypothetical protein